MSGFQSIKTWCFYQILGIKGQSFHCMPTIINVSSVPFISNNVSVNGAGGQTQLHPQNMQEISYRSRHTVKTGLWSCLFVVFFQSIRNTVYFISLVWRLKQLTSRCSKIQNEKKITVNSGQVKFSGEIYYTDLLIQVRKLTKSSVKYHFSLHYLLRY